MDFFIDTERHIVPLEQSTAICRIDEADSVIGSERVIIKDITDSRQRTESDIRIDMESSFEIEGIGSHEESSLSCRDLGPDEIEEGIIISLFP